MSKVEFSHIRER